MIYNKLVRDNIPQIIEKSGREPVVEILNEEDYYRFLIEKLSEEVEEFIEGDSAEELADILEVIDAILKIKGLSWDEIIKIKEAKRKARGGFKKRVFLKEVKD